MGVILGGPTAHKVFSNRRTGIVTALHWVNGEPAMCLFPIQKRDGAGGFVVCLSALHQYANSDGSPTHHLVKQAATAARVMGMEVTRYTIKAIADEILEHIEDVIKMPPEPPSRARKGNALGEVKLIAGGKTVVEGELTDAPPDGSTLH